MGGAVTFSPCIFPECWECESLSVSSYLVACEKRIGLEALSSRISCTVCSHAMSSTERKKPNKHLSGILYSSCVTEHFVVIGWQFQLFWQRAQRWKRRKKTSPCSAGKVVKLISKFTLMIWWGKGLSEPHNTWSSPNQCCRHHLTHDKVTDIARDRKSVV